MKKSILYFLLLLITINCTQKNKTKNYDLAIKNISIFDSRNKIVKEHQTILINSDSISAIINASQHFEAKKVIEGNQKLVIPGFIDTHMHLTQTFGDGSWIAPEVIEDEEMFLRVLKQHYLEYGITTIFDMGSPEKWLNITLKWQKNPSTNYPNIYMTGGALKSDEQYEPNMNHAEVLNPEHADTKVRKYDSLGIQHIKLYSSLNLPELKAVVKTASELNLNVYGHIDRNDISLSKAMNLGVRNFEHFFTVAESVFNLKDYEQEFNTRFKINGTRAIDEYSARVLFFFVFIKEHPELNRKMNQLMDELAKAKATVSTTIHVFGAVARKTDFFTSFQTFPLRSEPYFPSFSNVKQQDIEDAFDIMMAFLKTMHQKKVKIRIGTDNQFGGKVFLSELQLLYKAGFSIEDILTIATFNGAEAMSVDNLYGTIEQGKKADLIMFDNNPFKDFDNILGKKTIIKNGKVLALKPSITGSLYEIISDQDVTKGLQWYEDNKNSKSFLTPKKAELNEVAYLLIKNEEVVKGISLLKQVNVLFPDLKAYNDIEESQLNLSGYFFMSKHKPKKALAIFKYIVELFPNSWNAYDSLGEAYLANDDKNLAIKNYRKSVEINPENVNGVNALKKLE